MNIPFTSSKLRAYLLCSVFVAAALNTGAMAKKPDQEARLKDALKITDQSLRLNRQAEQIRLLAQQLSEAPTLKKENATKDNSIDKSFNLNAEEDKASKRTSAIPPSPHTYRELLEAYRSALGAYMLHRQQLENHVAAYHDQRENKPKAEAPYWPVVVQPYKPLTTPMTAEDACASMQASEMNLYESELTCFAAIQGLMDSRKFSTPQSYLDNWDNAERRALSTQQSSVSFNQLIFTKRSTSYSAIHAKVENAMRDGDYIESQDTYADEQRHTHLMHEIVTRANAYSHSAMQFLIQLHALNPHNPNGGEQSAQTNVQAVDDPQSGLISDQTLQTEFEQVQELYKKMQQSEPK